MPIKSLPILVVVALASSLLTIVLERALHPAAAYAQQAPPILQDHVLYAAPRGEDGTSESFIFANPRTGDIWVYENQNVKEHYRVVAVGQKLEQLKR
jgi:hypothetical protein